MKLHCIDFLQGRREGKRVTRKNTSKTDTRVDRYTADPSTTERKSTFKHSHELSAAKPKLAHYFLYNEICKRFINDFYLIIDIYSEERSVIIRRLNTVRRGIDRFNACVIKLVTRQQ